MIRVIRSSLLLALLLLTVGAATAVAEPVQQFDVQLKDVRPDGRFSMVFTSLTGRRSASVDRTKRSINSSEVRAVSAVNLTCIISVDTRSLPERLFPLTSEENDAVYTSYTIRPCDWLRLMRSVA